ncbi:ribonuclease H family protein [Porphyromonas pogonae]|uniref:ribonuclease H family protein n=1 Tax=Porphyromonas pogonae TaxID=867595 RepID=UPI002E76D940|nr:ribonuclease H family protein [Porphyromonas pogonae]
MAQKKWYVVWEGTNPGIYETWNACLAQVEGYLGAKYKSFLSFEEARKAMEDGYEVYYRKNYGSTTAANNQPSKVIVPSICVDAACSGNPGKMEYRGVFTESHRQIFHVGPLEQGTNNIGEFLALVHGLALLKKMNSPMPIYTDSMTAISWIKKKQCKTLIKRTPVNEPIFDLIQRAENWLRQNTFTTHIYKWDTARWGEIPADFGRK